MISTIGKQKKSVNTDKSDIEDLETAFAEEDATVTTDASYDTSLGTILLNEIQLPTDEDLKRNKFLQFTK